jgi:hypothetical protein
VKTSKKDFAYFQKSALEWQSILYMDAWQIFFGHVRDSQNLAWIFDNIPGRSITMILNKEWGDTSITRRELNLSAFHETCEIMLTRLDDMAKKGVSKDQTDEVRHEIIRILEKVIWKPHWEKHRK